MGCCFGCVLCLTTYAAGTRDCLVCLPRDRSFATVHSVPREKEATRKRGFKAQLVRLW